MSARRTADAVALILGAAVVGACVPSDPALYHDVAVRRTAEGDIEVLPCTDNELEDLRFLAVEDPGTETRQDEVIWWVEFDPAETVESVVLGELPSGAEEREAWDPDALVDRPESLFTILMEQSNGNERAVSFELADLEGDVVLFDDEVMTTAQFDDTEAADDCA